MNREEILRYMAENGIYPAISRKGKIFLKSKKRNVSSDEQERIIRLLKIKDRKDCKEIREKIREIAKNIRGNKPIKDWVEDERPREMLLKYGAERLPLSKLLAIIIRTGREGISAEELSKRIINRFKTLRELDSAPISEICKIEGIGMAKAVQIKAAFELGKRLVKEEAEKASIIRSPKDAVGYVMRYYFPYLRDEKKEYFYTIFLDIKNHPISNLEISKGGTNRSIVEPKEILKEAILRSASSIILVHNHPSGDPHPSKQDIELTEKVRNACRFLDIRLLDHVIIGKNREDYFSFSLSGLL